VPITETSGASKDRASRADKPVSDACFNDWKRFCFVLREIASGENGCPLSGLEAQKRAQAVLAECGMHGPGESRCASQSSRCFRILAHRPEWTPDNLTPEPN
jgi:hypothetical protein